MSQYGYEVSACQFPISVIARGFPLQSHNWEHLAVPLGHFACPLQAALAVLVCPWPGRCIHRLAVSQCQPRPWPREQWPAVPRPLSGLDVFVPSRARLEGQLGLDAKRSSSGFWWDSLSILTRPCLLWREIQGHANYTLAMRPLFPLVCSMYWRICSVPCPEKNACTVMKMECSCTTLEPKILRQRENQATPTSACGSRSHGLCFSLCPISQKHQGGGHFKLLWFLSYLCRCIYLAEYQQ